MSHLAGKADRNTFALMGMAALLITNSHLEKLYPRPFWAADGLLGNLVFFLLAGYGVSISQSLNPGGLAVFYGRRLRRIYPSLWPAVGLAVICGVPGHKWTGILDWVWNLVWPTDYRFIAQILILYPVVWWMARLSAQTNWLLAAGAGVLWLGIWLRNLTHPGVADLPLGKLPNYFWWVYFTWGTFLGAALGRSGKGNLPKAAWGVLLAVMALYFALKLELSLRVWTRPETASTLQLGGWLQLMAMAIVVLTVLQLDSLNGGLERLGFRTGLEKIGTMSLQFYLLHQSLACVLETMRGPWWGKVATLYVATYGLAWILWRATVGIGGRKQAGGGR